MNAVHEGTATRVNDAGPKVAPDPAAAPLVPAAKSRAVGKVANATTLLQAITQAARDPAVDVEKMERLFALHERLVKNEAEAAFNAAKSRAQSLITKVVAKSWNDQTKSYYAKLDAVNKQVMPIITAEGLSVSFDTGDCPTEGWVRTIGILSHAAGHSREYHFDLPPDGSGIKGTANKTVVHAVGSTSSYARRYLLCLMFNIATGDDNDGNSDQPKDGAGEQQTTAGRTESTGKPRPPYKDADLDKYLPEWQASGTVQRQYDKLKTRFAFTPEQVKRMEVQ